MRLDSIRLHWVQVPLHEPFRISSGTVAVKDAILIELRAEGAIGWGEASPMGGEFYSSETPEGTWEFLRGRLVPSFLARPEMDPRRCFEGLGEFPGEPFAKAGLEGAVWDWWCMKNALPLWQALGSAPRPLASGAAIGLMPTVADLLHRIERFLAEGYQRIKIKIEPGNDIELVRAVRERFRGIPIMVDANAAYRLEDFAVFKELDRHNLMMIEQPLAREALAEHAELQRRLRTPVCLDESAESVAAIQEIARLHSGRIINIKVQRMGGLGPALQAHDLAQEAGIPCWLGTMPELGIASVQGLHLGTLPNFSYPTDVEASNRWFIDDVVDPPITVAPGGWIHLPGGPGMGYRVDLRRVERYRVKMEEFPG
jgi:O-succinylbenzoate synthase